MAEPKMKPWAEVVGLTLFPFTRKDTTKSPAFREECFWNILHFLQAPNNHKDLLA